MHAEIVGNMPRKGIFIDKKRELTTTECVVGLGRVRKNFRSRPLVI